MANYHLSIKVFSRGKGSSAVAKAAYRAAEVITNEYDGQVHDYTRKRGIVYKEILLPDHTPSEYADRSVLWNAVEKIETMKNSQLAREVEISLPVELTREQNIALAREFAKQTFVSAGMCADVCVHDTNGKNPHAHIMLTMRPIERDGSWGAKSRKEYILDKKGERIKLKNGEYKTRKICTVDWNEQTKAEEWRAAWAEMQNAALEKYKQTARVDHRSYERQGLDKIPTVHLGAAVSQMERRGIKTELGNRNRAIDVTNRQLRKLRRSVIELKNWLREEVRKCDKPNIQEVIFNIMSGKDERIRRVNIVDLKKAPGVLNFLKENDITDMDSLQKKVAFMREELGIIKAKIRTGGKAELGKLHTTYHKLSSEVRRVEDVQRVVKNLAQEQRRDARGVRARGRER